MTYPTRRKFGNRKQRIDGRTFDSGAEATLYVELKEREARGEIKDIECQVSVYLSDARILYKPDFKYYDLMSKREVWAEFKGVETPVWKIKRRLWKHYGPGPLEVYKGTKKKTFLKETVLPLVYSIINASD